MGQTYQPGICNIGRAERYRRYVFGAMGFVVAAGLIVAVPLLSLPRWLLLLAVIPLFGGFIGVYQGREAFCVRFAMTGVYNVGDGLGSRTAVCDAAAARRDRRRARRLVARSMAAALVVAVAAYLVVPIGAG